MQNLFPLGFPSLGSSSRAKKEVVKVIVKVVVLQCSPVQARYPSAKNHFRYGAKRSFGAGPSATRKAVKQCRAHFYLRKCKAAASLFPFVFGEGAWMIG